MVQQEYTFEESQVKESKGGIGKFIWNSETREFLGRDGASWGKVSLFYAVFYACLGSFFVGMLAVFVSFMPRDIPTYYGESSTMNMRGLNPGLGFRPQIDVEDHVIMYSNGSEDSPKHGHMRYIRNLEQFLEAKYSPADPQDLIKCESNQTYVDQLKSGKSCQFNWAKAYESTDCIPSRNFGYTSDRACVLIKLNKIISWVPKTQNGAVLIKCEGETSVDKDNLIGVVYHSPDDLNNTMHGSLDAKYFPFFGQKSYRAPFIWAQFNIKPNTLVNIECKAYAENIDNTDRMNRRGQTKFSLFVVHKRGKSN